MRAYRILGLAALLLFSCSDASRLTALGQGLLEAGQFDQAMELFSRAYMQSKDDPELLHGMALIFSLREITFLQAEQLLFRALRKESTSAMRFDLLLLLLHQGDLNRARKLYSPAEMSLEKYYAPEMKAIRYGLDCLRAQDRRSRERLENLPDEPYKHFFSLRCLQAETPSKKDLAEHQKKLEERLARLASGELRCLALASWPADFQTEEKAQELSRCRLEFPGQVALFREPYRDSAARATARLLFEEHTLPPYSPTFYRISLETGEEPRKKEEEEEEGEDAGPAPVPAE